MLGPTADLDTFARDNLRLRRTNGRSFVSTGSTIQST